MADILPAILPESYRDLKEKLSLVVGKIPLVHIDVCDGTLTREAHWPYDGGDNEWERLKVEDMGFPYWEELNFEAHLMVKEPKVVYEDWIRAGAERLIFQYESFEDDEAASEFLMMVNEHFGGEYAHLKIDVGLAANLDTPIERIVPHVLECDFIQLMAIPEIGSQGQKLQEEIFDRIKALRNAYPEVIISVDGGVNKENIERLIEAGAERLCIGSAIYAAESPLEALEDLITLGE